MRTLNKNLYQNLSNYSSFEPNTEYRIKLSMPINDENKIIICNAILENNNCFSHIDTESSALLTFILDNEKNGFIYNLTIRKLIGFINFKIFSLNDNNEIKDLLYIFKTTDIIDNGLKISGNLMHGFKSIDESLKKISFDKFYHLIQSKKILVTVQTIQATDGLLCGLLVPII
jgi:hypothetical protein